MQSKVSNFDNSRANEEDETAVEGSTLNMTSNIAACVDSIFDVSSPQTKYTPSNRN